MREKLLHRIKAVLTLLRWKKIGKGKVILIAVFLGLVFAEPVVAVAPDWVTGVANGLAWVVTGIAQGIGKVIVMMIGGVLIPIALYNDFVTSPVVGAGWTVVRDAVNMFFVIIFIVIAFGTILGIEKFKWRQQVPRLLLVAIFINFSRMLCGIMIDFSQVFMLTFINTVKDIAGGNFIQMFGLKEIMDAGFIDTITDPQTPDSIGILFAAYTALIMMLIVLVVVCFMTIAFLYRVILLWGLVTLAPLAWFFKSTSGILKTGGKDPYSEWWSKFTCALMLGPILAFFLWLALAVAGSGGEISGMTATAPPEVNLLSKILAPGRLITFIVGIALLIFGLDAANDACASADGTMGKLLGSARKASKAIVAAPAGLAGAGALAGARLGLAGAKGVGKWGYRQTLGRGVNAVKDYGTDFAAKMAKDTNMPAFLRGAASNVASVGLAGRAARAEEKATKRTSTQVLDSLEGSTMSFNDNTRKQTLADLKRTMSDPDVMKDPAKFAQLQQFLNSKDPMTGRNVMSLLQETYKGDAGFQKQVKEMEKTTPSLFGQDKIAETLDTKLNLDEAKERVNNLANSQLGNGDVVAQLKKLKVVKKGTDGHTEKVNGKAVEISAYEALQNGQFGRDKQKALEKGEEDIGAAAAEDKKAEPARIAAVIASGKPSDHEALKNRKDLSPEDLQRILAAVVKGKKAGGRAAFRQKMAELGLFKTKVPPASIDEEAARKAAIAEQIKEGKHHTQGQKESQEEWEARLQRIRQKLIDDNSTETPSVLKAFDFGGDGKFKDDGAKQDFSAAIAQNGRLLVEAFEEASQGEKVPSEALVRTLSPAAVSNLLKTWRSASGDAKQKAEVDLRYVFNNVLKAAEKVRQDVGDPSFAQLSQDIEKIKAMGKQNHFTP